MVSEDEIGDSKWNFMEIEVEDDTKVSLYTASKDERIEQRH